jgi:hypothetical protein
VDTAGVEGLRGEEGEGGGRHGEPHGGGNGRGRFFAGEDDAVRWIARGDFWLPGYLNLILLFKKKSKITYTNLNRIKKSRCSQ